MINTYKIIDNEFKASGELSSDVKKFIEIFGDSNIYKYLYEVANKSKKIAIDLSENAEAAYCAGLLHDISDVFPADKYTELANELNIEILPEEIKSPVTLHQKISQFMAKDIFGITNKNILNAIACHTTLKKNAFVLDKIVFIADKLTWEEKFKTIFQVDVSNLLKDSLDKACFCYQDYIWKNKDKLPSIHPWFIESYEQLGLSINKNQ